MTPPSVPTVKFDALAWVRKNYRDCSISYCLDLIEAAYKEGHEEGYREAIEEIACGGATPAAPEGGK